MAAPRVSSQRITLTLIKGGCRIAAATLFRRREAGAIKSLWPTSAVSHVKRPARPSPNGIVQAVQNPTRQFVLLDTGLINDVHEGHGDEMRASALLNDQQTSVPEETFRAYESYSVRTAVWSAARSIRSELAEAH